MEKLIRDRKVYDVIVIGGGPGGYTAALYTARAGLSTLVLEKLSAGGQMTQTMQIDNYPGFAEGIDGVTLGRNMQEGAERFGVETENAEVLSVDFGAQGARCAPDPDSFKSSNPACDPGISIGADEAPDPDICKKIETDSGTYLARTVIVATGADHRHLGLAREQEYVGKGISYCAACDGMFYRGKDVAVVGGGNSAAADALVLSRLARKVTLIHRRDTLRAAKVYHDPLMRAENVECRWNRIVTEFLGSDRLTGVKIRDVNTGMEEDLPLDGLFISVGRDPAAGLFRGTLSLDASGYIIADETTRTEIPGVFAVGDVRTKAVRQIVTATADGAAAAHFAEEYLSKVRAL